MQRLLKLLPVATKPTHLAQGQRRSGLTLKPQIQKQQPLGVIVEQLARKLQLLGMMRKQRAMIQLLLAKTVGRQGLTRQLSVKILLPIPNPLQPLVNDPARRIITRQLLDNQQLPQGIVQQQLAKKVQPVGLRVLPLVRILKQVEIKVLLLVRMHYRIMQKRLRLAPTAGRLEPKQQLWGTIQKHQARILLLSVKIAGQQPLTQLLQAKILLQVSNPLPRLVNALAPLIIILRLQGNHQWRPDLMQRLQVKKASPVETIVLQLVKILERQCQAVRLLVRMPERFLQIQPQLVKMPWPMPRAQLLLVNVVLPQGKAVRLLVKVQRRMKLAPRPLVKTAKHLV